MTQKFHKMHGLGNDFVIMRAPMNAFSIEQRRFIADRHRGIGCDQFIVMEPPQDNAADIFMRIYNPDGSEAGACGNATRCVAHLWMTENNKAECVIQTIAGLLRCVLQGDMVQVDMGAPKLDWHEIPLAHEANTLQLAFDIDGCGIGAAVSMGNPHCVFFVDDIDAVKLETLGPLLEKHDTFPQRANIEFAQIISREKIRMRVWERGAGVTQACGSGACATMVAAIRRNLSARRAEIILDGGSLFIEWHEASNHVLMTGPIAYVFEGEFKSEKQ